MELESKIMKNKTVFLNAVVSLCAMLTFSAFAQTELSPEDQAAEGCEQEAQAKNLQSDSEYWGYVDECVDKKMAMRDSEQPPDEPNAVEDAPPATPD
jgi:hypothetical protein